MRSSRRHPLLLPVLLIGFAVLVARPGSGSADADASSPAGGGMADARVAGLYRESARATHEYEEGRRRAGEQRALAERLGSELNRERRRGVALRDARETSPAVREAIDRSRRSEARLAAEEARASSVSRALERRTAELAALRRDIGQRLDEARQQPGAQPDDPVTAVSCKGAARSGRSGRAVRVAAGQAWVAPVKSYELSAGFGSGGARWANRHTGQDFAVPLGTPVRAVGAGRVVRVSCGGPFGIQLVLRHPDGFFTQYAHLSSVAVGQGEAVTTGQRIARSGSTGNSSGPHLHFEVRRAPGQGSAVDPLPWLAARGAGVG